MVKCKNRMLAMLLVLGLLLAGCGNRLPLTNDGATEPTEPGSTEPESAVTCQYLPRVIENPDNLPVLKWVCLTYLMQRGGIRTWNEDAAIELNQMLADRNMPFRVQFVLLSTDQSLTDYRALFNFPETYAALEDADLIYGAMNADDMVKYLTPITQYVNGTAEPSLKNAVPHELSFLKGTVGGEIYGYCTRLYNAKSSGWEVDPDLLAASGITAEDFQRDFWEMDDVFARLFEANGNQPFLYLRSDGIRTGSNLFQEGLASVIPLSVADVLPLFYDVVGSCFAVDYNAEIPTVINYLENDVVRKIQAASARYIEAKYTISNDPTAAKVWYGSGVYRVAPYYTDDGKVYIPLTGTYFTATEPGGFINGVAAVSQHQAEAIALLNLIAEDEAFRMQLLYGKEGRDYKIEDGYYSLITREDGSDYGLDFLSPLAYFCGLTSDPESANMKSLGTENWSLIPQEGMTALQAYQERMDGSVFSYPIFFDDSGLEQELNAMQAVFKKYFLDFAELSDTQYDQMLQELKAAGSDKVLAQLQQQLTQWQKDHPKWTGKTVG